MKTWFVVLLSAFVMVVIMQSPLAISYAQTNNSTSNTTNAMNATSVDNETALAADNVNLTVTPFAQVPGGTVLLEANGLAPNANTTIIVDNRVAARSETDENGTQLYALGVPDQIVITEIRVDNSTGEESVRNITHSWDGTVRVVVRDQFNNTGSGELTVIKQIGQGTTSASINNTTDNSTGS